MTNHHAVACCSAAVILCSRVLSEGREEEGLALKRMMVTVNKVLLANPVIYYPDFRDGPPSLC